MAPGLLLPLLVASTRVAIVPIVGADDRAGMERVVDAVSVALDAHVDLEPVAIDELYAPDGVTLMAAVPRCGADAACVRAAVATFGAQIGVVVVLNRRIEPAIVQVEVLSGPKSKDPVRSSPTSLGPAEAEDEAIRRLTMEVLRRAGFDRAARIVVDPKPADATITLNEDVQQGRNVFRVAPGTYRIGVTRDGHHPFDDQRVLAAGDRWDVTAHLEPKPEDVSVFESPWFWAVTAGVVVAGGVAAGVAISQGGESTVCVCTPEPCTCP